MNAPSGALAPAPADLIIRRLATLCTSRPEDAADIRAACSQTRRVAAGELLGPAGARLFLLSGWACRARATPRGGGQLVGFLLPGDLVAIPDGGDPPHHAVALTQALVCDGQGLADAGFAQAASAETVRHLDHIVRLAAMSASEGMAHMLIELHDRLAEVGLAAGGRFPMPLSQEVLARALGLSEVHTNRVLTQLRRQDLIELGPGWVELRDAAGLKAILNPAPSD